MASAAIRWGGTGRLVVVMLIVGLLASVVLVQHHVNLVPSIQFNSPTLLQALYSEREEATTENFVGLEQENPALVAFVKRLLLPPSRLPYNLTHPNRVHFSQYKQSAFADDTFLKGMRDGVFLEVGALDGEDKSNTLHFEKYRGWSGLLVEPDPKLYSTLTTLHRKAHSINAGLAFTIKAGTLFFRPARGLGRMITGKDFEGDIEVKVFPLYTLLLALELPVVDFFSLDIEGDEMKVLQTLPWGKVRFRLMCIEINHLPGGTRRVLEYLEARGYTFLGMKDLDAWFGLPHLLQETMDLDKYLKEHRVAEERRKYVFHGR